MSKDLLETSWSLSPISLNNALKAVTAHILCSHNKMMAANNVLEWATITRSDMHALSQQKRKERILLRAFQPGTNIIFNVSKQITTINFQTRFGIAASI